jgi:putative beta-lysine N-acetyltransferase
MELIGKNLIQHDGTNNRIYLMKVNKEDSSHITEALDKIAEEKKYSKIIAKVPLSVKAHFLKRGYKEEAVIPCFYSGRESGVFLAKYFTDDRMQVIDPEITNFVLEKALKKKDEVAINKEKYLLSQEFDYRIATEENARAIAEFYKKIFKTYPFPVHDYQYILKTMGDNVIYFTIWKKNELVAISSSEMDKDKLNAEMTDFGTLPEYRGRGFALYLLVEMERSMKSKGIITAYSIARAVSYGMNITFSKMGYSYAGTLVNNTNISGSIESMNVWYKNLQRTDYLD